MSAVLVIWLVITTWLTQNITWAWSGLLTRRTDWSWARSWRACACWRRSAEEGRPGREGEEGEEETGRVDIICCMAAPIRGLSDSIWWRRFNWGGEVVLEAVSDWSSLVLVVMVREEGRLTGIPDWRSGDNLLSLLLTSPANTNHWNDNNYDTDEIWGSHTTEPPSQNIFLTSRRSGPVSGPISSFTPF